MFPCADSPIAPPAAVNCDLLPDRVAQIHCAARRDHAGRRTEGLSHGGRYSHRPRTRRAITLPFAEFITLMALLMCLTALSIDIMLPSLPDIAAALNVTDLSQLPLIISLYMGGLAVGQLSGDRSPTSMAAGGRCAGLAVFALASLVAATSQSFHFLIAARFLQGFAGAAGRIISTAVVRDLFAGRQMARVMSTIMMVFILVPIWRPRSARASSCSVRGGGCSWCCFW